MKKSLQQIYGDMPIYKKMAVTFVGILIFFITLLLLISNTILYHSNIGRIRKSIQDECRVLNERLGSMYDNMRLCQNSTIQGINQVYEEQEIEEVNEVSFISIKNNLEAILKYYCSCFADVDSLVFLDQFDNAVEAGLQRKVNVEALKEMASEIPSTGPIRNTVFPIEEYEAFYEEDAVFCMGMRIIRIETGETLGYLFVNAKTSSISELFPEGEESAYPKNYYIVDQEGRIAVTREREKEALQPVDTELLDKLKEFNKGSFETTIDKERYLVTSWANQKLDWILVNEVRIRDILRDIYLMTASIIVVGVISVLLAILLILFLTRVITNPIQSLTETARQISDGDLSSRCEVKSQDEVGILAKTFNRMLEQIETLLKQIRQEQRQKREAELALFQLQIKPHFLYNTLEQIYMCCQLGELESGGKITKALADFYRTALSGGAEVITIEEELKNISNYLMIQQERYSDILKYKISAEEECLRYRIPKMTLQPLVENAIYHGLKEKGIEGKILIDARAEDDCILILVSDDGVGMEPGRFQKILSQKNVKKEHFGVKNVHDRIKLYFGEEYGLSVDEEQKEGLGILIRIPKVEVYHD